MTQDSEGARLRERVWVTKIDHTTDPPRPIEEIFVENGDIVLVTPLDDTSEKEPAKDENGAPSGS